MLEKRDINAEINTGVDLLIKQKVKNELDEESKSRLKTLKTKIDNVEPYETSIKDYESWIREYNELLGR